MIVLIYLGSMANFEKPILHGLCTYGITAKIVMQAYCDNKPDLIRNVNCRFVNPVFPGDTFKFKLWNNDNIVFLSASTIERRKEVIFGEVELNSLPKPKL